MLSTFREAGLTNVMVQVTGEPDTGKTLFALQSGAMPSETVFLDSDVKGRATVEQLLRGGHQFGFYRNILAETKGMRELEYFAYYHGLFDIIEELPAENRRVIVCDTWEPFEKTLKPVVQRNPKQFREFYSAMGSIRGAEEWLASFDYEASIINRLVSMCDLLILVNHVKNYNIGGKRVAGKFVPDCKRPVIQKALLRLWLKHNSASAVPIGLVLKRLGKTSAVEGTGIRTINVLPRKITPSAEDESLWDTIRRYWDDPVGNRPPQPDEVPNSFELSILDGHLTEDQRMALRASLLQEQEEEMLAEGGVTTQKAKALEMKAGGATYKAIGAELGIGVAAVVKMLKG